MEKLEDHCLDYNRKGWTENNAAKRGSALFARMAVAARSHPDLDIADVIGTYWFSCAATPLFSADGHLQVTNQGRIQKGWSRGDQSQEKVV